MPDPRGSFRFRDGERLIAYGPGVIASAVELLDGPGYVLLTTPRGRESAPHVAEAAAEVVDVPPGRVDELAGDLLPAVRGERLVALGGGRVIDTAKALASAHGAGSRAMAIPTTLSGAEMTILHRRARGAPAGAPPRRAAVVIFDPGLAASQPEAELAASAANALGHAVEGPCTRMANPVAALCAEAGARLIAEAFAAGAVDRPALALGALLSGYVIDSTGYGLHHVAAQTLAREGGVPHAIANAALLPHTTPALARRAPGWIATLDAALGAPVAEVAGTLARRARADLRRCDVTEAVLARCASVAAERPDLDNTPPRADETELRGLYESALLAPGGT